MRQWRSKVRFRETIEAMHASGVRLFVELGPRGNLSAFASQTVRLRFFFAKTAGGCSQQPVRTYAVAHATGTLTLP